MMPYLYGRSWSILKEELTRCPNFPIPNPGFPLAGVFPPIPTPFDAQGEVAYSALADKPGALEPVRPEWLCRPGSNGEAVYVAEEEKLRIWQAAGQAIPAGKTSARGTGCHSTRATNPAHPPRCRLLVRMQHWPSPLTIIRQDDRDALVRHL